MNTKIRAATMLVTFNLILSVALVSAVDAKDLTINSDKVENVVEITDLIEKEISKSTDPDQIARSYNSEFLWSPEGSKLLVLVNKYIMTRNASPGDIALNKCGEFGLKERVSSLFWMNADGTGFTNVARAEESLRTAKNSTASWIKSAAWSSNGDKIVLELLDSCKEKPFNYYVMDRRGSIQAELKSLPWSPFIQWNNDRSRIAIMDVKDNTQLHIIDIERYSIKQLQLGTSATMYDMKWSPDGKKIAYIGYKDGEVYTIDAEKSISKKLTSDMQVSELSWTPDGTKLVFSTSEGIYTVDADGGKAALIEKGKFSFISWSPDGKKLLFINSDEKGSYSLHALDIDSMTTKLVVSVFNIKYVTWSPDSKRIAYRSDYSSSIYTVNVDGTGKVTLPGSYSTDTRTEIIPGVEGVFDWGQDNKIYYTNNDSLVKINPDGTGLVQLVNNISADVYSHNKIFLSHDGSRVLFIIANSTEGDRTYILKMKGCDEVMSIYAPGSIKQGDAALIEVKSMSKPVENATIFLNGGELGKTNKSGFLVYNFKESGNFGLSAVKQGYRTSNISLTIKEQSSEQTVSATVTPAPTVVDNTPRTPEFGSIFAVIALIFTVYRLKKTRRIK